MSKKGKKDKQGKKAKVREVVNPDLPVEQTDSEAPAAPAKKMSNRAYLKELEKLEAELVHLQSWVIEKGLKVVIVFEGRDGAGKGGTIKAITGRVSPRVFRVVALPAPTEREKTQMYVQRYLPHLPAAGEVVIFDRSWYNRAGVERVMGFATEEQVAGFPQGGTTVREADGRGSTTSSCSSTGWKSTWTSRPAGSKRASPIRASNGSCRRWTSSRTAAGTTTRAPATTCSVRRIPSGHPGSPRVPTTRSACA
jgi:hypothetical protein